MSRRVVAVVSAVAGFALLGSNAGVAIDRDLDCARISKKLASARSFVRDLEPGPHAARVGSVRGEAPERAQRQDDVLKQRQQKRQIAKLMALARGKGCPG